MLMKEKQLKVLSCLNQKDDWATASEIALAAECSVRSVKTYIADLNTAYPDLIATFRKRSKKVLSMDEIIDYYGSTKVRMDSQPKLKQA